MEIEEATTESRIETLEKEISENLTLLKTLRKSLHGNSVEDYLLKGPDGAIHLSELFDGKEDLIIVHNMGSWCAYCTMWADGFNGVLHHLESRAAFAVVTPDLPEKQAEFAAGRGWRLRMISDSGSRFTEDMGFRVTRDDGMYIIPGYTTFRRQPDGTIRRIGSDTFGPGDIYSSPWHMFDMLEANTGRPWRPRLSYDQ